MYPLNYPVGRSDHGDSLPLVLRGPGPGVTSSDAGIGKMAILDMIKGIFAKGMEREVLR